MKIDSAIKFENKISAMIDTEGLVEVHNVSIVRTENGEIKAYPPTREYPAKNGNKGYEKIIFFKDFSAADAEAARMVNEKDEQFYPFSNPVDIKGGQKIGIATLKAHVALKVSVLPATEEKPARLLLPNRVYTKKGETEKRTAYFVWPFTNQGEELKAEIAALIEQITAEAKPYEPKSAEVE